MLEQLERARRRCLRCSQSRRHSVSGRIIACALLAWAAILSSHANAQVIKQLTVEIKTADERFAGTDDDIHLEIAGLQLPLDNPDRDDFERNNRDTFVIPVPGRGIDLAWLRELGTLAVVKTEDSFWGGGWGFEGIRLFGEGPTPIYQNDSVNRSLDGSHQDPDRTWRTDLDDPGWNLPEPPPPWPPCTVFPDVDEGGPKLVDSDCDGIPDDTDTTTDIPPDTDGDGLPDAWEEQNGEDPLAANPDVDADGWSNVGNLRSVLVLSAIEVLDEREDLGNDEIYVVAEDVRFPVDLGLDGYWSVNDGDRTAPSIIVDVRVSSGLSGPPAVERYKTRLRLRESDFEWFESPTDDTYTVFEEVQWPTADPIVIEHQDDDLHYRLTFISLSSPFLDPSILDRNGDIDDDQLGEHLEFLISSQDVSVQPTTNQGYDGLADPSQRELFVEIEGSGAAYALPFDALQAVASRYYYNGVSPRFDALIRLVLFDPTTQQAVYDGEPGYLGGGQLIDQISSFTLDDLDNFKRKDDPIFFAEERDGYYRYGIFATTIECAGSFGCARGPSETRLNAPGKDFLVSKTIMLGELTAIVLLHEIGHTLSLCHPEPDADRPVLGVACTDYTDVPEDAVTAMGTDVGADSILAGAIAGAVIGCGIGAGVAAVPGCVVGGVVGGLAGAVLGFLNSDAWQRTVDYHPNEWASIRFFSSVVTDP